MLLNNSLSELLLLVPALLISLTVHELCHGLVAYWLGDNTAKREGRLSLNPIRHIDWIGFIMLMTVGFGWAKPVPVDSRYFKNPKQGMALTALAGPVSNIVLAFISAFIIVSLKVNNWVFISTFLAQLFTYNCAIAMFNFLPIPPLDGSKILGAFLPNSLYFKLMRYERYGMIIMILLLYTGVLSPVLRSGVQNLMHMILNVINLMGFK